MRLPSFSGLVSALAVSAWSASSSAASLTVEVVGMTVGSSAVMAAVFDRETDVSDSAGAVHRAVLKVERDLSARWLLVDLPKGSYGIGVFHDLDGDGLLDKNLFGLPTEPYGFSNGARGLLGPPAFGAIRFELGDEPLTVRIEVR